ncbi:MAG TPA: helix-turn-helix domain-containing protein [Xanthobacteraceae bacterium]
MEEIDATPQLISLTEAARILRISKNTAYAAAQRGDLPVLRIGRLKRVNRRALQQMIDGAVPKPAAT